MMRSIPLLSKKNLLRLSITAFWLTMICLLAKREWAAAPTTMNVETTGVSTIPDKPRTSRLGILLNNRRIGYAQIHYLPLEDGTAVIRTRIEFTTDAAPTNLSATAAVTLDRQRRLASFSARFGPGQPVCSLLGKVTENQIELVCDLGGQTTRQRIPFHGDAFFASSLTPVLDGLKIFPGERRIIAMWNPLLNRMDSAVIEHKGRTRLLLHGRLHVAQQIQLTYGQMSLSAWFTEQGDLLRQEAPFGIVLEKEPD